MTSSSSQPTRFIALDVHKHYIMVGVVDAQQQVVLRPHKLSLEQYARWYQEQVYPTDVVVIEATGSAWHLYDQLTACGVTVVVANPLLVKWIGSAPVKTDTHDTLKLAHLLATGLLGHAGFPSYRVRVRVDCA